MICIRRARPSDAAAIGAVHVATWRTTYAGVLPDDYLARLSPVRHALGYEQAIASRQHGHAIFVAVASGPDAPLGGGTGGRPGGAEREGGAVVGFVSGGRARRAWLAQGEVETLYLLDDFRERGIGRRLMRAMAAHLAAIGCRSAMLWVLSDNPTRWFYRHLGGRPAAEERFRFAGQAMDQTAFLWDPIDILLAATAPAPEG
ncbi:GNAT family N-acetyltransferase [Roseicella frigidaeris]|uniref:GNAT family N-acetyltransferase n=1 Tax=Roseicella frigidaeris TaxID=2230885 RepID=A0A327M1D9_9PROT|nr:GNAT family N-acetyltransferase [Roseicella frigidaeris]RAI55982.1 GNAT family N-acetyltransferase [Roseicella frigidaeris]